MKCGLIGAILGAAFLFSNPASAQPPKSWDGLVQVDSRRLDLVYLRPGADFTGYSKVLLEPIELAFEKRWQRDYNRSVRSLGQRVSDSELQRTIAEASEASREILAEAWTSGGYAVVQSPAPDVLRVKTGVVNISVTAPERPSAGRSHSFSEEAGSATFFVEVHDSMTGALLGRAIDSHVIGDSSHLWRTRASNRADFRDQLLMWAKISVEGLSELKSRPAPAPAP